MLVFASCLAVCAETEEQINKRFSVEPGGKLVVDVDFGSIDVTTNATSEVVVDVFRKVTRGSKANEVAFLRERPVTFAQDGNTITVQSRARDRSGWSWRGKQRLEGRYTITVPAQFAAQIKTSGGGISVADLTGEVKANTSGGGLKFARVHGSVGGHTSGGSVRVTNSEGDLNVNTSGGGIDVSGGAGTLKGGTSGGSVTVKDFRGAVAVKTSGGGINIENVKGRIEGSTSGGSITVGFASKLSDEVKLATSGGGVTVRVPEDSAFDLDASTSGGSVSSDLPVSVAGKPARTHLKGPVNGGGRPVVLRTSGGSIRVKKL
jgi:hypothetical protein